MSIVALAWAKQQKTGSPARKAVLMVLADFADEDGKAWPSVRRIEEDTELSERTVRTAIKELKKAGLINIVHRTSEATGLSRSNAYFLALKPVPQEEDSRVQELHPRVQELHPRGARAAPLGVRELHPELPYKNYHKNHSSNPSDSQSRPASRARAPDWPEDYGQVAWEAYGKKVDRKASILALDRLAGSGSVAWDVFIGAVQRQAQTVEPQFRPSLERYIKRERWTDSQPPPSPNGRDRYPLSGRAARQVVT